MSPPASRARATVVYLDGTFLEPHERPTVSLFDRGYLLGDSVFETLRCYRGVPFRLGDHLERFEYSAAVLGIPLPAERVAMGALVREAVARSGLHEAALRITLSRGEGVGTISPASCTAPVLSIVVRPLQPYPAAAYVEGIQSSIVSPRRIPSACIDPAIKCGNYLPSVLARRELEARDMLEGVQLSVDDEVVGGSVSNVFVVAHGRLRTPHPASGCLPGVTRAAVLALAGELGLPWSEDRLRVTDLYAADEMFFTNSLMECLPVAGLDHRRFAAAPGPVTRRLHEALRERIRKETETPR